MTLFLSERSEPQEGAFQIGHLHVPYYVFQNLNNVFTIEIGSRHDGNTFASIEIILRQKGNIEVLGKCESGTYHTFELGNVITGETK